MYILYVILAMFVFVVVAALIVSVSSQIDNRPSKKVEETAHYCEREGVYCIHAPHDDGYEVCQGCSVSVTSSNDE